MHLYVIRHADAVPLGETITEDAARPLTSAGHAQSRTLALTLRKIGARLDRILTSPLVRARETAQGLQQHWGDQPPPIVECDQLAPGGKKREILERLREQHVDSLAIIGHNPELSELVGWFLGEKHAGINLEKAGLACLEFDALPGKGSGMLAWLVTPLWCDRLISS